MESIAIGWKKPAPGKAEVLKKKTHSQKRSTRKIPPPKQQEITQKTEPYVSRTVRWDQLADEIHPYTPAATTNPVRKSSNTSGNIIQIYNDKRLCSVRAAIATFIIIAIIIIAAGTSVGIMFAAIKSQDSSASGNNNQNSFSTISTGLLTSSIRIGNQIGLPCSGYIEINDPTRSFNYTGPASSCDNGQLFNTINGGSWIRFVGPGGTKIPFSSPGLYHCGAFLSSWYNDTSSLTPNVITNGTVCFDIPAGPCGFVIDVSVVYCYSSYYVYFLPAVSICNARYCTA